MVFLVVWFTWLVGAYLFVWVFFFSFQCEVKKNQSSGTGRKRDRTINWLQKSTHLKVPGLDLNAKAHAKGSLSHLQTYGHMLHTHQAWSCGYLELSVCRKLGWDGPPWITLVLCTMEKKEVVPESQGLLGAPGPVAFESWGFLFVFYCCCWGFFVRLILRISDKWLQDP